MDFGVTIFPTDLSIGPAELAREAEDRGFASFFIPEHTHIPTSRKTQWPGGAPLPEEYRRTLDPFVALGAAAAATSRIRLGTGVCLVAQRDPLVLAKEVATLDLISGGRFDLGIGVGWNVDEMEHHGVDPGRRRSVVREKVLAMKALWTQDEAEYHGEFVDFSPSWSWPKPVQHPHPPIWMGGAGGPVTFRHIAEYCDAWMPISGRGSIADQLPALHAACEAVGRDPATVELHTFGARPKPETLEHYRGVGVRSVILGLPPAGRDVVLPILDSYVGLLG